MADLEEISVTIVNKKMDGLHINDMNKPTSSLSSTCEDLNNLSKLSITIGEGPRKVTPNTIGPNIITLNIAKTEGAKVIENLEGVYMNRRMELLEPSGYYNSPFAALTTLTRKHSMALNSQVYKIILPDARKWEMREQFICSVRVGLVCGKGQSNDERMAKMLASADLLKKLDVNNDEVYGLHPGSQISKMVFALLATFCARLKLPFPKFSITVSTEPIQFGPMFKVLLSVGDKQVEVSGDDAVCAKRKAALDMVEMLGAKKLPLVMAKIGDEVDSEIPAGFLPKQTTKKRKALEEEYNKYASENKFDEETLLNALNPPIFTEVDCATKLARTAKLLKVE